MKLNRNTVTIRMILFIGIFIALNLLASAVYFRLDFTGDKRYTLSKTTKDLLKELDDPVTVTAYFSKDLPANIVQIRKEFKDLLAEYHSYSGRNVDFEFIDPNKSEETEKQAQQAGIQPVMINVRERDQAKQQRVYLGAVVKLGAQQEVIPFIQPGAAMEYALSKGIKKIATTNKAKVGFIQGHGEPGQDKLQQAMYELTALYETDTLTLNNPTRWAEFKTLVMLAPSDTIPPSHLNQLDEFLKSGGSLFLGVNAVGGDLSAQTPWNAINTGIESWLRAKGIDIAPIFLTDTRCGKISVRQQQGMFVFNNQIDFYYFPLISNWADHPLTKGLESVNFQFASPLSLNFTDSALSGQPIAFTSNQTGKINPPTFFDMDKKWNAGDFPYQAEAVGAVVEGKFNGGSTEGKIVVFTDGDFAVNPQGQGQMPPNQVNLLINGVDYLTDDTGLIELRTKGVQERPIEKQLEDTTKTIVKIGNFALPILIVILFGVIRMQRSRRRRLKWAAERFE